MKIKKLLTMYLFTFLLCSAILIPTVPIINQPSTSAETATPCSDYPIETSEE